MSNSKLNCTKYLKINTLYKIETTSKKIQIYYVQKKNNLNYDLRKKSYYEFQIN